jgi:hypothetical protein
MLKELYDAYEEEGLTGIAKTSPAILGVGTQTYKKKGASPSGASAAVKY